MQIGIVRGLDDLGRVTIPMEYRRTTGIRPGNRLGITLKNDTIHITLPENMGNFVGMDRPVDELGRITLPKEIRNILNMHEFEPIEIKLENGEITMKKVGCHYCGKTKGIKEFKGYSVCRKCEEEMHEQFTKESA